MNDERKAYSPFEPPETDSKPKDNKAKLRGDRFGIWAYRISCYVTIIFFISLCITSYQTSLFSDTGSIALRCLGCLWILGQVIAILVAITSFFLPASNRKAAINAILLSVLLLAFPAWIIWCN